MYTEGVTAEESIRFRFHRLASTLDERALRLFAASEAEALGYGGISRGVPYHRIGSIHNSTWTERASPAACDYSGQDSSDRGRTEESECDRSDGGRGVGASCRAFVPRRSDVALTMDLQKHSHISGDSATHGSRGQPPMGMGHAARIELQSPRQSKDGGRQPAPGPKRAV